jgi:ParB family transcriptional regulator, chromosome partitioning protein
MIATRNEVRGGKGKRGGGAFFSGKSILSNQETINASLDGGLAAIERTKQAAADRLGVTVEEVSKLPAKVVNGAVIRGEGYQMMPVKVIRQSPWNRKEFDPVKMKELCESVRVNGVLQPISVRRFGEGKKGEVLYEIILGDRRWQACCTVGREMIPVIVRDVDDREAEEMRLTENLQREDLRPMDEARGYARLKELGASVEEICAKVNVEKSTVYGRLRLLELPEDVQRAADDGRLPASHAELITRIDDPREQKKLAKVMLNPKEEYVPGAGVVKREVVSFREAKALVDVAKKEEDAEAEWQKKTAVYREKGHTVLSLAASEKVFHYGSLARGYVAPGDKCQADPERRTWADLLGKSAPVPLVVCDGRYGANGKPAMVYARRAADAVLKQLWNFGTAAEQKVNQQQAEEAKKAAEKQKLESEIAMDRANVGKIVAAAELREPNSDVWRFIVDGLFKLGCESDSVLRRRGIAFDEEGHGAANKAFEAFVKKCDGRTLRGLVIEMLCWRDCWNGRANAEAVQEGAALFKVKVQALGKKG